MARRKQEAQLQVEIESTEEFEDMMNKEGLTVVDVYQEWCGPCRGMVSNLRKLKNELGDPLLHFAVAKADTIDSLENYRGKCEPCFLFFATGCLVSVIRGANSPLLVKTITEQLAYEHKVLEGSAERKEDPFIKRIKDEEASPPTEEEEEEGEGEGSLFETGISLKSGMRYHGEIVSFDTLPKAMKDGESSKMKGVTVAIIKPDVVADGKVDDIIEEMKKAGIEILEKQERQLTEEEAREFYDHKKDEAFFEDLIKFMTSGPSVALVLTKGETGEGIIEEWRELLGPPSVEEAKESAPDSLRARFGHETYVNAVHGSDSTDMATKELAFFFPTFAVPTIASKTKKKQIQRTLALIRPDALAAKKDDILEKIKEAGFSVAMQKEVRLSPEQAAEFYKEHEGQPYYEDLVNKMSGGPLLALALARDDAVQGWRDLLGPKEVGVAREEAPESFRAQFSAEEDVINPLHGSDNPEHAKQELDFFFPMQKTVAVIKPDAYENKDDIMNKIKEAGFNIAARKETELTKEIAEEFYKAQEESEYFQDLTQHMTSGKTLFMVLTKEDAVDGWRSMIGPTDPEEAKEAAPDTIRAQFGHNSLANAVHGSANQEEADKNISLIFGDLDVTPDGRVKGAEGEQVALSAEELSEQPEAEEPEGEGEAKAESGEEQPAEGGEGEEQKAADGQEAKGDEEAEGETAEQSEAKEPDSGATDEETTKTASPEAGFPEAKSPVPSAKSPDPSAKSPEETEENPPEGSDAKTPEAASPEPASQEPKSPDAKTPEPISTEAKSPEETEENPPEGSDAKTPEAASPEPASQEPKSPDAKTPEAVSPEPGSGEAKSPEAAPPEDGASEEKPPEGSEEAKSPETADA